MDSVSPRMVVVLVVVAFCLFFLHLTQLVMDKISREKPLLAQVAALDRELFKARNELLLIKREAQQLNGSVAKSPEAVKQLPAMMKEVAPKAMIIELESIKRDRETIARERDVIRAEHEHLKANQGQFDAQINGLNVELVHVKSLLDQAQQELAEAESVVQECVDEKKKLNSINNNDLMKAVDTLRDQLNNQKEAVSKYEAKIKRREHDLKDKTRELRNLRAEAANAKLQVDKVASERDGLTTKVVALEAMEQELTNQNSELQVQISVLEAVKVDLNMVKERLDEKEEELETANTEVSVLKETIVGLKASINGSSSAAVKSDNGFEEGDGWDVEDDLEIPGAGNGDVVDFEAISEIARLKVDLAKAQSACEQLSEQLMVAEAAKEKFEVEAKDMIQEVDLARKAKEIALNEKCELGKKHEVLALYFNQREIELQKQLGVQTQRLGEVEVGSESVGKKFNLLYDELESYKSQCKSLKQEMEEQV